MDRSGINNGSRIKKMTALLSCPTGFRETLANRSSKCTLACGQGALREPMQGVLIPVGVSAEIREGLRQTWQRLFSTTQKHQHQPQPRCTFQSLEKHLCKRRRDDSSGLSQTNEIFPPAHSPTLDYSFTFLSPLIPAEEYRDKEYMDPRNYD